MKKLYIFITGILLSVTLTAQENTGHKEIGIVFNSLNNFGVTFKTGSEKAFWRFNTVYLGGSHLKHTRSDTLYSKISTCGMGLGAGREYRTNLAEKIQFRYGADLFFSFSKYRSLINDELNGNTRIDKDHIYKFGLQFVVGLNYLISENFLAGIEVLPSVNYQYEVQKLKTNTIDNKEIIKGINYGLSNNSILITLAYRF